MTEDQARKGNLFAQPRTLIVLGVSAAALVTLLLIGAPPAVTMAMICFSAVVVWVENLCSGMDEHYVTCTREVTSCSTCSMVEDRLMGTALSAQEVDQAARQMDERRERTMLRIRSDGDGLLPPPLP